MCVNYFMMSSVNLLWLKIFLIYLLTYIPSYEIPVTSLCITLKAYLFFVILFAVNKYTIRYDTYPVESLSLN